jgi:putative ABC transport system permease protein
VSTGWIIEAALRVVPPEWRPAVRSDLRDELPGRHTLAIAGHATRIGIKLRAARLADRFLRRTPAPDPPRRSFFMRDFGLDLRVAVRGAWRQPGYALAVIATLAIGIGANTAIFSVFNWILFRPLPGVTAPEQLVTVRYQRPKVGGQYWIGHRDYADLRDRMTSFSGFAASAAMKMDVATGAEADRLDGEVVTPNYLSVLGVAPLIGRDFTPDEERPGTAATAIISQGLWRRAFGGSRDVLGKTLTLDGKPFTIVGVLPSSFQGRSPVTVTNVWVPVGGYAVLQPAVAKTLLTSRRQTLFGDSFGRLRPGVTVAQAQAEATTVADTTPDMFNMSPKPGAKSTLRPVLTPRINFGAFTERRLDTIFRLLMGAVGLLLLLACANAGNLLLARASGRRREIAVCQAIGASRRRIIRQQLAEGLVLSLVAGAAGLVFAAALTSVFDGMRIVSSLPAIAGVTVDWRVCAFTLAVSMLTGGIFAVIPAVVSSRVDLQSSLKNGVTTSAGSRRFLRAGLVTFQVTVSILLLVSAGLFMRTLQNIRGLDLGLELDGVISLAVQPGRYGYTTERADAYVKELLRQLRAAPGVDGAAFTWTTSFSDNRSDTSFVQGDKKIPAATTMVSPGFFQTVRIPLIAGRDFTDADLDHEGEKSGTVVVSRSLAQQLFPAGDALGSSVTLTYPVGKVVEVIGIVGDVRGQPVTDEPEPWAYHPAGNVGWPIWGTIQVRSALPTTQAIATIRQVARKVDPLVMPYGVEPFGASVDRVLTEQRLFAKLSAVFAAIGALLAAIGIYGMMAGAVSERRKEFGIRLALGAGSSRVLSLVLRNALALAAIGVVIGLGSATGLRRFVASRLYGVSPLDPLTLGLAVAGMLALATAATLIPALRAARVDPVRSLRVD